MLLASIFWKPFTTILILITFSTDSVYRYIFYVLLADHYQELIETFYFQSSSVISFPSLIQVESSGDGCIVCLRYTLFYYRMLQLITYPSLGSSTAFLRICKKFKFFASGSGWRCLLFYCKFASFFLLIIWFKRLSL